MNSDFILNVLETVKFVFCLQIHALAKCIMNEKFCIYYMYFDIMDIFLLTSE